jgi:outer membrane protein OmpA-like peptidoglycan-associated protein
MLMPLLKFKLKFSNIKKVIFFLILASNLVVKQAWSQTNCSIDAVLDIKNSYSLSIAEKENQFIQFRRQCQQYQRITYAQLANLYYDTQNYKLSKKYYAKILQSNEGIQPNNIDELKLKYALSLHFLKIKELTAFNLFLQVQDKYNNNLPSKLNHLYHIYQLSLSTQVMTQELILAQLSSSKIYKNLRLCPSVDVIIHFDYDSDSISNKSEQQILEIRSALNSPELVNYQFELIGHTDKRGSKAYNQLLSLKRAKTVKFALLNYGPLSPNSLKALGKGEMKLKLLGDSEAVHQVNRRVEIRVVCAH